MDKQQKALEPTEEKSFQDVPGNIFTILSPPRPVQPVFVGKKEEFDLIITPVYILNRGKTLTDNRCCVKGHQCKVKPSRDAKELTSLDKQSQTKDKNLIQEGIGVIMLSCTITEEKEIWTTTAGEETTATDDPV